MDKDYTYSAFISYSSKDEKIAKALWKKLERYRLPAVLQKQYEGIPEKMHIFLDQGDIVPGDTVENALSRELADSKKLIVICSPNSAKSPYVELEVKNFLSLGHSPNDIIPYIIEGEVNRDSPNNCYVPSLFGKTDKETINGVSVLRDGKWKAFVGVLANLLDVKFDEIYKREKVRRNRIIVALSGLGFLFACFIGLAVWYVMPHTRYYRDYITKWGIPVGIYELNEREVREELTHYEITTRFGRPQKLIYANSKKNKQNQLYYLNHFNRPVIATYDYKYGYIPFIPMQKWSITQVKVEYNSGCLTEEDRLYSINLRYNNNSEQESSISFYFSDNDNLRKSLSNDFLSNNCFYFSDISRIIVSQEMHENLTYSYPELQFLEETSSIYQFRIKYDENGYESFIGFYNYNDKKVCDRNKIEGINQEFDEKGRIVKQFFTFQEPNRNSIPSCIEYEYDEKGNQIYMGYYDYGQNIPLNNRQRGFSYYNKQISENIITYSFFDDHKNFTDVNPTGVAFEKLIVKDGLEKETNCYSVNGTFFINATEQHIDSEYDDFGHIIYQKIQYWDEEHNLIYEQEVKSIFENDILKESNSVLHDIRINEKNILKSNYEYKNFDNENVIIKKTTDEQNITTINEIAFDNFGRKIREVLYVDDTCISGEITYGGENCSITFKKNGKYYKPYWNNYAQGNFKYDNNNNLISCDFKDENNNYISATVGFSKYEAKYSVLGEKTFEVFKNEKDEIVYVSRHDFAWMQAKESLNHKYLESKQYYDENNQIILSLITTLESEDSYKIDYYYKNELKRCYYFKNDSFEWGKIYIKNKKNIECYDYDKYSRLIGHYLYDWNYKLQIANDDEDEENAYAYFVREYNEDSEIRYFYGINNNLLRKQIKLKDGDDEFCVFYENGNQKSKTVTKKNGDKDYYYYYENGNSKKIIKTNANGEKDSYVYSADGTIEKRIENKEKHSIYYNYDSKGNILTIAVMDNLDRLLNIKKITTEGSLRYEIKREYNEDGSYKQYQNEYEDDKSSSIQYFDINNKRINGIEGYHSKGIGFDENKTSRIIVLKADEEGNCTSLSNMSGKIVEVYETENCIGDNIQINDVVLVLGDYHYFPLGSESELKNSIENAKNTKSNIVVYRPNNNKIYSFILNENKYTLVTKYAGDSIKSSEKYIKKLKKKYVKWNLKNQ